MTRRDWWTGVLVVVAALLLHAALPRYEWMLAGSPTGIQQLIKLDRWSGRAYLINPTTER